jgi:hypothetical protein
MKNIIEFLFFLLLPIGGTLLSYNYYQAQPDLSDSAIWFRLVFPALLMYAIVITSVGILRLWTFQSRFAVRGVPILVGFNFSAVANLLAISISHCIVEVQMPAFALLMCLFGAVVGTLYDMTIIKFGLLKLIYHKKHPNASSWQVVKQYALPFFGITGLYTGQVLQYYSLFNPPLIPSIIIAAILGYIPFSVYVWYLHSKKIKYKKSLSRT